MTFEEAASCFADDYGRFYEDREHHDRVALIAYSAASRLVFCVHAELDQERIRIISARLASKPNGDGMKKNAKHQQREPSVRSLADVPSLDFAAYTPGRPNPFASGVKAEGVEIVHEEPTAASMREIPELGHAAVGRANPYAKRTRGQRPELQVGRGRPVPGREVGPTTVKSVRLPPRIWKQFLRAARSLRFAPGLAQLEKRAKAQGVALHALIRAALVELLERTDDRRTGRLVEASEEIRDEGGAELRLPRRTSRRSPFARS